MSKEQADEKAKKPKADKTIKSSRNPNKVFRTQALRELRIKKAKHEYEQRLRRPRGKQPVPRGTARALRRERWAAMRRQDVVQIPKSEIDVEAMLKSGKLETRIVMVNKKVWVPTFAEFTRKNPI